MLFVKAGIAGRFDAERRVRRSAAGPPPGQGNRCSLRHSVVRNAEPGQHELLQLFERGRSLFLETGDFLWWIWH